MRVTRIFQECDLAEGKIIELDLAAFQHIVKVLRLQPKDPLIIFNGKGQVCTSTITSIEKRSCSVQLNSLEVFNPPEFNICLIQAIIKPDKMDLIIQKAVELGVTQIMPVISKNCDVKTNQDILEKKYNHWQKVIIGACEQCGENYLPKLFPIQSFAESVKSHPGKFGIVLDPYANKSFADLPDQLTELSIIIGPEGGLTTAEINLATDSDFIPIQLGNRILRAETAAIASLSICQYRWADML